MKSVCAGVLILAALIWSGMAAADDVSTVHSVVLGFLRDELVDDTASKINWMIPQVPTGGLLWIALLPVDPKDPSKEQIVLIDHDAHAEGDVPVLEMGYLRYIVTKRGPVVGENLVCEIVARRVVDGRFQYLEAWHIKGESGGYRAYTMADGKWVEVLQKKLPTNGEEKFENDTRTKEDFTRWQVEARAWPAGFVNFSPTWKWIPLAEFITSEKPVWRDPATSPVSKEDYAKLAKMTPQVTWDQFVEWMRKQKHE